MRQVHADRHRYHGGRASGENGAAPTFVPATLAAYNGKPYSGRAPSVIFIASLSGKPTTELDFTARQQSSGPYGLAFTQIQFPGFPTLFDITKFRVNIPDRVMTRKVHGKSVKVHLIDARRRATARGSSRRSTRSPISRP